MFHVPSDFDDEIGISHNLSNSWPLKGGEQFLCDVITLLSQTQRQKTSCKTLEFSRTIKSKKGQIIPRKLLY